MYSASSCSATSIDWWRSGPTESRLGAVDESNSRGVRSFVDIRKGEFEPALLFFFFWFLVIVVFQALRPLKKGLFVEHLGADVELYAKLANIGVAILAVVVFTALYNRFGSRRLIPTLCAASSSSRLLGFAGALGGGGVRRRRSTGRSICSATPGRPSGSPASGPT